MNVNLSPNTGKPIPLTEKAKTPSRRESTALMRSPVRLSDEIFISPEGRAAVEGIEKGLNLDRLDTMILENKPAILEATGASPKIELVVDPYGEVDPDRTIARRAYLDSLVEQANRLKQTIHDYYSEAHAENSSMPLLDALRHIGNKYLDRYSDSPEFRADMSYNERQMAYYQERSLLTGRHLKLYDPYALASVGGPVSFFKMQEIAEQAAKDKLNTLLAERRQVT